MTRFSHIVIACFLLVGWSPAQDVSLSISPLIDTLNARLLRNPSDFTSRQQLIDAYTLAFQPELALMEILGGTGPGKPAYADAGVRGRVQFSLEQLGPATASLQQAYLESPSDETLLLLAVLCYARGEEQRGLFELRRLKPRSPALAVELLKLYERFYLNGRRIVASATRRALREVDPVAYETYFPSPLISVLSPANFFTTEARQLSVVWEVRHNRPLKRVSIGPETVFERSEENLQNTNADIRESYTRLVSLHEGHNALLVTAEDVFGNTSTDTVVVNGLNFDRRPEWTSPSVDSLRTGLQYLRNYIPDSVFAEEYAPGKRSLILGGSIPGDSTGFADRALFLHEFLTNPLTGDVAPDESKLLIKDRVSRSNVTLVMNDWLLKGATFQSVSLIYLGGMWRVSDTQWSIRDVNGEWVDVRPWLQQLRSLATSGVVILIDGSIDGRSVLETGLRALAAGSSVPLSIGVVPPGIGFEAAMRAYSLVPRQNVSQAVFKAADLRAALQGIVFMESGGDIPFARNPSGRVTRIHSELTRRLSRKLADEKISASVRNKIQSFSNDWRRYNEITRYLDARLSLSDFIVRVDEYLSRTDGGGDGR